jgi:phage repressor protein C with HTH and peptisase S24 domain
MSPLYNDGDYVITTSIPLLFNRIADKSVVVFKSPVYGILIKKVIRVDNKNGLFFVKGINPDSISSEKIGPVKKKEITGIVLFHIKKK